MAEADLDAVIRQFAKAQNKSLMAAAKKRQGLFMAKAASAKDKEAKARFKLLAQSAMLHGHGGGKTAAELCRQCRRQLRTGDQERRRKKSQADEARQEG